mmetsp:Transcript_35698/g.142714  ORF Transcript_35698/g.142714 Transcript_35698/m.142714 type:complete len:97 (-) Transcript_35698:1255-1545(-)
MKGFVFCVEQFMGGVVAGVSGRVILLKWEDGENNTKKLVPRSSRHGQILVLALDCVDKWILSVSLEKSVTLANRNRPVLEASNERIYVKTLSTRAI